ncbi:ABC transporter permease [Clostridium chromiireducens]|uniref:ABC transporter permease n=1 Tax=Clostridium chromiireducens TaxID=225345 RepID=A0A964RJW7_9CLOT|nr:ABC transporter permease [Clostridium chromiireducens]MVX63034.1 ABC transporter permease [Clostridium chromiireducens]
MLGKLMKYEIKATGRILIPLYIALLAFAAINKIFIGTGFSSKLNGFGGIPFLLSIFGYGCTMAAVFIVTFFVIIQRFYKNLLGDEGYLMNTLPVTTITNIISKLSIATFWNIISGIIAVLSVIIMAFDPNGFSRFFTELSRGFSEAYKELGGQIFIVMLEGLIAILVQFVKFITMIYASISIGHLFSKHRILSAFGAFIVLNLITTAISSIVGITFSLSNWNPFNNIHSFGPVHLLLIGVIIINLIFFAAYFIITHYILKNKLNLE